MNKKNMTIDQFDHEIAFILSTICKHVAYETSEKYTYVMGGVMGSYVTYVGMYFVFVFLIKEIGLIHITLAFLN